MDAYLWVTDNVLNQIKALDSKTFPGIQKVQETKRAHEIKKAQEIVDRIERRVLYKMIGEKRVIWEERSRSSVRYYCIILHISVRRGSPKVIFYLIPIIILQCLYNEIFYTLQNVHLFDITYFMYRTIRNIYNNWWKRNLRSME